MIRTKKWNCSSKLWILEGTEVWWSITDKEHESTHIHLITGKQGGSKYTLPCFLFSVIYTWFGCRYWLQKNPTFPEHFLTWIQLCPEKLLAIMHPLSENNLFHLKTTSLAIVGDYMSLISPLSRDSHLAYNSTTWY